MLKITIVAAGKLKEKFWVLACEEYLKRLQSYVKVKVVETSDFDPAKSGGVTAATNKESSLICSAIPESAYCILLDVGGELLSSEGISSRLDKLSVDGRSEICFVIGGSCGVNEDVQGRAQSKISFGKITLPHNLARVVLLEQLYRAMKISKGEPYHK